MLDRGYKSLLMPSVYYIGSLRGIQQGRYPSSPT
jgi:hypothetical protein